MFTNVDSQYDSVFKAIITAGWANESDGDVECPDAGYFAKVDIDKFDRNFYALGSLAGAVFDNAANLAKMHGVTALPEPGHYLATENSDGRIYVFRYNNAAARDFEYRQYVRIYQNWSATANA